MTQGLRATYGGTCPLERSNGTQTHHILKASHIQESRTVPFYNLIHVNANANIISAARMPVSANAKRSEGSRDYLKGVLSAVPYFIFTL